LAAIIAIYIDVIIAIGEMLVCALEMNRTDIDERMM
jgi:preprotein translocase subunit SecF